MTQPIGFSTIKYWSHAMTRPGSVIMDPSNPTRSMLPELPYYYPENGLSKQQNGKMTGLDQETMKSHQSEMMTNGLWGQIPFFDAFQRTGKLWTFFDDEQNHEALNNQRNQGDDIDNAWRITNTELEWFITEGMIGQPANWGTPTMKLMLDEPYREKHSRNKYYRGLPSNGWCCPGCYPSRGQSLDQWKKIWGGLVTDLEAIGKGIVPVCILQPWYTGEPLDSALIPKQDFIDLMEAAVAGGCQAIGLWSSAGWNGTEPEQLEEARAINVGYATLVAERTNTG